MRYLTVALFFLVTATQSFGQENFEAQKCRLSEVSDSQLSAIASQHVDGTSDIRILSPTSGAIPHEIQLNHSIQARILKGFEDEFVRMYGRERWNTLLGNAGNVAAGGAITIAVTAAHGTPIGWVADSVIVGLLSFWVFSSWQTFHSLIKQSDYEGIGAHLFVELNSLAAITAGGGCGLLAAKRVPKVAALIDVFRGTITKNVSPQTPAPAATAPQSTNATVAARIPDEIVRDDGLPSTSEALQGPSKISEPKKTASELPRTPDDYLLGADTGNSIGIKRIESLVGRQAVITDVSDVVIETRAISDPRLRVINLGEIFREGRVFVGFGRPNVYIGIPHIEPAGLGYRKVDAKSLKRADTKVVPTGDRVQSGLLVVFKDLPDDAGRTIFEAAKKHEGTRQWTCVNANCRILSDAGITIGGETLANYYFPVRLLKDILQFGLEHQGRPLSFDVVKTTPGYLEDIGLSITQSVQTAICRHANRSCDAVLGKLKSNSFIVRIDRGLKSIFGLAIFDRMEAHRIKKPAVESQVTRLNISNEVRRTYDLDVSEPSQFGRLLRLLWGPHSLFEITLPRHTVDRFLPEALKPFPDKSPPLFTRMKRDVLFNPGVVNLIRSQLSRSYRHIEGMTQKDFFDMLRTHSDTFPNKYNFVLTGRKLIVMKLAIRNSFVDWVLSKHVLMSRHSKDVRASGEIWKTADGTLHFNLNSGTYKPDARLGEGAESLFHQLFPGVHIELSNN